MQLVSTRHTFLSKLIKVLKFSITSGNRYDRERVSPCVTLFCLQCSIQIHTSTHKHMCAGTRKSKQEEEKKWEATRLPCKRSWLLFWLRNWIRQFDKIALFPGRRHCWWWRRLVKQNYGAKARLQKKRVIYTATATHTYRQAALLCVKLLLVLLPLGGTYVVCPHVANTWCVMWRTIFFLCFV